VTGRLSASGTNVLLVRVDNSVPVERNDVTAIAPLGGDFNVSGGLYRHVALISTADTAHFDLGDMGGPGVYATTTSIANGVVHVRTKLTNDAAVAGDYIIKVSLLDAAGQTSASTEQTVALDAGGSSEIAQDLSVATPHLWQGVADPYLYRLVAELLKSDGSPVDRVVQSFGIREIRFDPDAGFFLNGQPVRLHGAAMHQDFLGKGWAISAADMDTSLAFFQEIGANAIRLGHYPFNRYALERVSELGLVAYVETALGLGVTVDPKQCSTREADADFVANAEQQLQEMIRQEYNYPAIVLWGIGNETSARQIGCDDPYDNVTPVLRALNDVAKREDPSRPTVYAEFPHPMERTGPFATEGITDLFATNRYFLWYHEPLEAFGPLLDALHAKTPKQPLGLSEYGAGSAITQHSDNPQGGLPEVHSAPDEEPAAVQPEEYASYAHEENYRIISSKPYLWGAFVWNMFDFGSANHNEGDTLGVNTKGLVTFDRQTRKDPFYFYKANWSAEPVIYITSRRYTDRAYPVVDVKVYSNADTSQLIVNGTTLGSMTAEQCPQSTCVFRNVTLSPGRNAVTAVGDRGGAMVSDAVDWSLDAQDIHIAAGQLWSGYVSSQGIRFGSDDFFSGGLGDWLGSGDPDAGIPPTVRDTDDPQLYKYYRRGDFSYDIPLPDAQYEVTLGFVEPDRDTTTGERLFNVVANGRTVLENFDVLRSAGANRTVVTRAFNVEVSGGHLILDFNSVQGEALVSTISIVRNL
jgi:beta-galactosidase